MPAGHRADRGRASLPTVASLDLRHYGWELAVAGYGLPSHGRSFPAAPLYEGAWRALVAGVLRQRIGGALHAAVKDAVFPCTSPQGEELQALAWRAVKRDLAVEARLVQTYDLLRQGGISHRFLKGITTAARVYPSRQLRSYCDVDVLVEGPSFEAAVGLLEASGGERRYPEARPGFDKRFSKGTSFWMPDGISVDLHRTFVLGPYGFTVDLAGVFSRSDSVTVAGRPIPCLEILDAAVHACLHAALGDWPPRLAPMRDVVQFVSDDRIETGALLERAGQWRCLAVVARALALAQVAYGLADPALVRWSEGYRPERWEDRAIALYGEGHTYRRQAMGAVRFVPGGRAKLAYVRDLAFPTYLRQHDGSILRRGMRALGLAPDHQGRL